MSPHADPGWGPWSTRLDAESYGVVWGLTKQLPNLPEARLAVTGLSPGDAATLLHVARDLDGASSTWTGVVLTVDFGRSGFSCEFVPAADSPARDDTPAALVSRACLDAWRRLLDETVEFLGQPETFYRTGYRAEEVELAVAQFRGA